MSTEWLAVQSFKQTQDLLAAIAALSIHIKLQLAGVDDRPREKPAKAARDLIASFLGDLDSISQGVAEPTRPIYGANIRLRDLTKSFLQARRDRRQFRSVLFRDPILRTRENLLSDNGADQEDLLESLSELRILLETHTQPDAKSIFGDI